ncbi:MAG: hypothetical protein ACRDNF_06040 [Streptosporangiaceae bacterium]
MLLYPNHSWRDPNSPFAFFLTVINTYLHPESTYNVDDLAEWLRDGEPQEEIIRFKDEFRSMLTSDLDKLPPHALSTAAEYEDGSDEAFLQRLWHELYSDEPVQT